MMYSTALMIPAVLPFGIKASCVRDLAIYSLFRKLFEKKFYLTSDYHIEVYIYNSITQDRVEGSSSRY